jgi:hypothetical protein
MVLDDEIIGLRSRLDRLQRSLRFIDEPVATALIKGVIADMEARIAAVESDRQQQAGARPAPLQLSSDVTCSTSATIARRKFP